MSKRYRIDRARLRAEGEPEPVPGAYKDSLRSYLATLQGTARVRAFSIEDINLPVNLSDTHKTSENLSHLDFTRSEIAFPDHSPPRHRKYIIEHRNISIVSGYPDRLGIMAFVRISGGVEYYSAATSLYCIPWKRHRRRLRFK